MKITKCTHVKTHKMEHLKNLFPEIKIDEDKHFNYQKEAVAIYADEKSKPKVLAMIKIVLDRRPDLKSEVYNQLIKQEKKQERNELFSRIGK